MSIPRLMLLGFIVPMFLGVMLYASIASYEPSEIPVAFDVKNLAQYPLHKSNFHTENGNYVLNFMPDYLFVYGLSQHDTVWEAARELGLSHRDLSEDWVDYGDHRTYKVDIKADIATIYEIEFIRYEQWLAMEWGGAVWGYDTATIKFKTNNE